MTAPDRLAEAAAVVRELVERHDDALGRWQDCRYCGSEVGAPHDADCPVSRARAWLATVEG